mmetsp:Transcript_25319/g.70806  ORF Transcript_25319/g.70806 Transcript_25319/m.70806 type:complete len:220 (-) Transcript_25319:755-1414(-)
MSGWSRTTHTLWMASVMSQRPCHPLGRITRSPGPKGCLVPSGSVTQPLPESTMNHSVVGRSDGESQPPSVQAQEPTDVAPFTRERVKSCGSPLSTFLRRPLGVSLSSAKYDSGACRNSVAEEGSVDTGTVGLSTEALEVGVAVLPFTRGRRPCSALRRSMNSICLADSPAYSEGTERPAVPLIGAGAEAGAASAGGAALVTWVGLLGADVDPIRGGRPC